MDRKYLTLYCKVVDDQQENIEIIHKLFSSFVDDVLEEEPDSFEKYTEGEYTVFEICELTDGTDGIPKLVKSISEYCSSKPIAKFYPDEDSDALFGVYFNEGFSFFTRFDDATAFANDEPVSDKSAATHNNFRTSIVTIMFSGDQSSFDKLVDTLNVIRNDSSLSVAEIFELIRPSMDPDYESENFGLELLGNEWSGEFSPVLQSIEYVNVRPGMVTIGFDVFANLFGFKQPNADEIQSIVNDLIEYSFDESIDTSSLDQSEVVASAKADFFADKLVECVETLMYEFLNILNAEEVTLKFRNILITEGKEIFSVGGEEDGIYITRCGELSLDHPSFLIHAAKADADKDGTGVFRMLKPSIGSDRWDVEILVDDEASIGEDLFTIVTDYWSPKQYAESWIKSLKHLELNGKTTFNFCAQSPEELESIDREDYSFECYSIWKVGENEYQVQDDVILGDDVKETINQETLWEYTDPWPRKSGSEIYSITESDLRLFKEHLNDFVETGEHVDVRTCWLYDVLYYHPDLAKPQERAMLDYFETGDYQKYISNETYIDPYVAMYFAPQDDLAHLKQRLEVTWHWVIESTNHKENNFKLDKNSIEDRHNKVLGGLFFKYGQMYSSRFFADVFLYFYGDNYTEDRKSPIAIGPDKIRANLNVDPTSLGTQLASGIADYLFQREPELLFDTQRYKYLIDYFISILPFIDEACFALVMDGRKKQGSNSAKQHRMRGLLVPLYGYTTKYESEDGFLEPQVNDKESRDYLKSKIESMSMSDSFVNLVSLIEEKQGKVY